MNARTSATRPGDEPIPGYVLRKRLGAGGYGEVWLADAPGGLKKAVKLVYGHVGESRASAELKSLERVRSANHPFLLSIERIEIVDGKVVIVTELAESSLQDRFENCRRQGLPGIPRMELLDFLRDTADALDFLAQKHSLQHLDVKPGNLLIVADRIKVADFGLVKDLHDSNQSLVGGLTPTYSAPEVFDGRPDFRSDQYSLAIVYAEMLTGRLPFLGSSPGELARQHLSQAPNLDPLPPADRSILHRALSKNPLDRYSTCRQFVDQLFKVRSSVLPVSESSDRTNTPSSDSSSGTPITLDTNSWANTPKLVVCDAISADESVSQWKSTRAMFIGLGGQGVSTLRELRRDILHNVDDRLSCDDYEWLAIDTNSESLEAITSTGSELERLHREDAVELPVQSPHSYRKYDAEIFTPLSRRWLYNIPRSQKTEGVRPIATLCLIAHYPSLCEVFNRKLERLIKLHEDDHLASAPMKVYVVGSLHGATGAALLAEVGMIVRNSMSKLGFTNYRLSATVSIATTTNHQDGANLASANAIVSLSELTAWMDSQQDRPHLNYREGYHTSNATPFDWVTFVDGGLYDDTTCQAQNPKNLARAISLDCQTPLSSVLADSRLTARQSSPIGWLRTACSASIADVPELAPEAIARWCSAQAIQAAGNYLVGANGYGNKSGSEHEPAKLLNTSSVSLSQIPLPDSAAEEFSQWLLKELGFLTSPDKIFTNADSIAKWARRLSDNPEFRSAQLGEDLGVWQGAIRRITEQKHFNWPQITRIQVRAIAIIQWFNEQRLRELISQFERYSAHLGVPADMQSNAHRYLSDLAQSLMGLLDALNVESRALVRRMNEWWKALKTSDLSTCANRSISIPRIAQSQYESTVRTLAGNIIGSLLKTIDSVDGLPEVKRPEGRIEVRTMDRETIDDLRHLIRQAKEQVVSQSRNSNKSSYDSNDVVYHHSNTAIAELERFTPTLASSGGQAIRLIVAGNDQMGRVAQLMDSLDLVSQTTLLPVAQSFGVQVLCDATHLSIPHLIATLWRPSAATLSLAERLRTRNDIDWPPVVDLLQWKGNHPSTPMVQNVEESVADSTGSTEDSWLDESAQCEPTILPEKVDSAPLPTLATPIVIAPINPTAT